MNIKFTTNFIQMVKTQASKTDFYVEQKALITEQNKFNQLMNEMGKTVMTYVSMLEELERTRVELYRQVYSDYLAKQSTIFGDTLQLKQMTSMIRQMDIQKELKTLRDTVLPEDRQRCSQMLTEQPFD